MIKGSWRLETHAFYFELIKQLCPEYAPPYADLDAYHSFFSCYHIASVDLVERYKAYLAEIIPELVKDTPALEGVRADQVELMEKNNKRCGLSVHTERGEIGFNYNSDGTKNTIYKELGQFTSELFSAFGLSSDFSKQISATEESVKASAEMSAANDSAIDKAQLEIMDMFEKTLTEAAAKEDIMRYLYMQIYGPRDMICIRKHGSGFTIDKIAVVGALTGNENSSSVNVVLKSPTIIELFYGNKKFTFNYNTKQLQGKTKKAYLRITEN